MKPEPIDDILNNIFQGYQDALKAIKEKETHCFELLREITQDLETLNTHYELSGVSTEIIYEDGNKYKVTVEPVE